MENDSSANIPGVTCGNDAVGLTEPGAGVIELSERNAAGSPVTTV